MSFADLRSFLDHLRATGNLLTIEDEVDPLYGISAWIRRTSDVASAPFSISASILNAKISPNPDQIPALQVGVPLARNLFAQPLAVLVALGARAPGKLGDMACGVEHRTIDPTRAAGARAMPSALRARGRSGHGNRNRVRHDGD
jgi:3-polyprenyl-4-hydroxybenzoate decarboxylase